MQDIHLLHPLIYFSTMNSISFLVCLSLLFSIHVCCFGQVIVGTAGDTDSLQDVRIAFTIGEPIVTSFSNEDNILTQGFHQPSYQIVSLDEGFEIPTLQVKIYPNPSSDKVHVSMAEEQTQPFQVSLFSQTGTLLLTDQFSQEGIISVAALAEGIYFLQIEVASTHAQVSYKLIKI